MTKDNTGAVTLAVGNSGGSSTFSGVIDNGLGGTIAFTKNGAGTQILSGMNTYGGATTVNGGKLLINSPGILGGNSVVTVNNGCTLGGSGTIYGTINMVPGSMLVPGDTNVIATLTLANNSANTLTLNGNTLRYDISNVAGVCDKIALTGISGGLALNGVNTLSLIHI